MTTLIEAARQALEALEDTVNGCICRNCIKQVETITSLCQAIEQAEKMEMFKEYGEGWESLAWELCADECGEEACSELIWEGGPIPEPWGDRWLKYEDEAKRLIALVQKHTTPQPQREWVGLTEDEIALVCGECAASAHNWNDISFARAIEAKLKERNHVS